jgi:hypothetical protein
MNSPASIRAVAFGVVLINLLALSQGALASERRFEPVVHADTQRTQTINGMVIVSTDGQRYGAGAALAPASTNQQWLSVSVKNTGTAPVTLDYRDILVMANGQPLATRSAEAALAQEKVDEYPKDRCANSTAASQLNCNIDSFNERQASRAIASTEPRDADAIIQIAPGQLISRQLQVDLPKKSKSHPATLTVSVTVEGEQLSFDFAEVSKSAAAAH